MSAELKATMISAGCQASVPPAGAIWREPEPQTERGMLEHLERHGFVLLRGLTSAAGVAELVGALETILHNFRHLPRIREGFDLEPDQSTSLSSRPVLRKVGGICDLAPAFADLMRAPRLLTLLHAALGPRVELYRDVCMLKPAWVGREKPWHQDSAYWPVTPHSLLSAMTALDDADAGNGCLQVVPGSHRSLLPHSGKELQVEPPQTADARYVPLAAGDCLLFHSLLLHASEPNHSPRERRACIVSYKGVGQRYVGEGPPPEYPLVSELRG